MRPETRYYAARKFLEGLVLSGCVFFIFLHFFNWPAYFVLGLLVASILAIKEFHREPSAFYIIVATANAVLWPAMVINNVTSK